MNYLILFITLLIWISFLDFVWFSLMKNFYISNLLNIIRIENGNFVPNIFSAIVAWCLLIIGHLIFIYPLIEKNNYLLSITFASTYGLIVYGIYNLTNHAILKKWPILIIIIDILWGLLINASLGIIMKFFTLYTIN